MKLSYEAKQIIALFAFLMVPLFAMRLAAFVIGPKWMDSRLSFFMAAVGVLVAICGVIRFMKNVDKVNSRNGYRSN